MKHDTIGRTSSRLDILRKEQRNGPPTQLLCSSSVLLCCGLLAAGCAVQTCCTTPSAAAQHDMHLPVLCDLCESEREREREKRKRERRQRVHGPPKSLLSLPAWSVWSLWGLLQFASPLASATAAINCLPTVACQGRLEKLFNGEVLVRNRRKQRPCTTVVTITFHLHRQPSSPVNSNKGESKKKASIDTCKPSRLRPKSSNAVRHITSITVTSPLDRADRLRLASTPRAF